MRRQKDSKAPPKQYDKVKLFRGVLTPSERFHFIIIFEKLFTNTYKLSIINYSIASALNQTFNIPAWITGAVITVLALLIIVGGIKNISKVSQVVVPAMAVCYMLAGIIVILGNISNIPSDLGKNEVEVRYLFDT